MNLHFDVKGLVSIKTIEKKLRWYHEQFVLWKICSFYFEGDLMENVVLFIFSFVFIFLGRLTIYMISRLRKKKMKKDHSGISVELKYLITKFNISKEKIDKTSFAALISFLDAIIISMTLIITTIITDNMVLEFVLGLILVIGFIYVVYEILGKILIKKGFSKDEL